jgi:Multimeric flavodoxin WrbA
MKNVLILSSSPRKGGNSDMLCNQFAQGASEAGYQVEKIRLAELDINYCTGCGVCFEKKMLCSQKDDMAEVLEKMVAADVIVLATPVYFYTMCGQMKTLIDRTCPGYTHIKDKDFYFIVTAADTDLAAMERTVEGFRGFTDCCLTRAREKGVIYGVGAWHIGEIKKSPAMRQAYEMGRGA